MIFSRKILLVGLIFSAATISLGEESNQNVRGEMRRLNGPSIRRRKPVSSAQPTDGRKTPSYAVSMEPLVKYSQRDPLYEKSASNTTTQLRELTSRGDYEAESSNHVAEYANPTIPDQYLANYQYQSHPYYQEPEPIIEIIIKESNESLPAPTTLPPPPTTKEPVHVFYVKYKKNPKATGKNGESDVIYEPPVPALTEHESDTVEPDPEAPPTPYHIPQPQYNPPQPSTTLRTIIRPDSEQYHSTGLRVTFGSPEPPVDRSEDSSDASSEVKTKFHEHHTGNLGLRLDSSETQPSKPHAVKRQQGAYFPPSQPPTDYQRLTPSPSSPTHQKVLPFGATQAVYTQEPSNKPIIQAGSPFKLQQIGPHRQHHPVRSTSGPFALQSNDFQGKRQTALQSQYPDLTSTPRQPEQLSSQSSSFHPRDHQRRPQFQPTLEAQIEEYQKHKLFLHQQNLRHQAEQAQLQASLAPSTNSPPAIQQQRGRPSFQPIHVQPQPNGFQRGQQPFQTPNRENNFPHRHSFSSHPTREPVNLDLNSRNKVGPQNGPSQYQYNSHPNFLPSPHSSTPPEKAPFIPSPQITSEPKHSVFTQPSQATFAHADVHPSELGIEYENNKNSPQNSKPTYNSAGIVRTISPLEDIQVKNDRGNSNLESKVEGSQNNLGYNNERSKSNENAGAFRNTQHNPNDHQIKYLAENHHYQSVYSSTTPKARPTFTSRTSGTRTPPVTLYNNYSTKPSSSTEPPKPQEEKDTDPESPEQVEKKNANLAALPDEVPDDLREQLLSSGILGNADIQILDYDKVGDIPIESLPPEALENLYGAGSEQVASVVKPGTPLNKKPVEMKVVRYDPNTKEGQGIADTYLREDATRLDPVVLNDSRYNRYLPLKISGTNFPLPNVPQLEGRVVNSVVVLAPVDYDFVKPQEEMERSGRNIQVEGVRFIAGDSLKTLVKEPTLSNYHRWLEQEKETRAGNQSVVLLVTSPSKKETTENGKSKTEIFMYDVPTGKVSKLRGQLSSTFVEVAESNSGSEDLDELASSLIESSAPPAL